MQTFLAKCFSRKDLFDGRTKSAEFSYTHQCSGEKKSAPEDNSDSFVLITANDELEAVWTVELLNRVLWREDQPAYGCWNKIKLQNSNKNISGNFVLRVKDGAEEKSTFDMNASSFEKNVFTVNYCDNVSAVVITIIFQIFYECPGTESYDKFLKNKNSADVTFFVGDFEFPALKRTVAARSVIFSMKFDSELQENKTDQVSITDVEAGTFKLLLDFIYSGKVDANDSDELLKLLVIADQYLMNDLVSLVGLRIANKLSIDNVVDVLKIAHQVKLDFLKDECWGLISKNKNQVFDTESYRRLFESHEDLLSEFWLSTFDRRLL